MLSDESMYSFIHRFTLFHFDGKLPFTHQLYSLVAEDFHVTFITGWIAGCKSFSFFFFPEWYLSWWHYLSCLSALKQRNKSVFSQVLHCTMSLSNTKYEDWIILWYNKTMALLFSLRDPVLCVWMHKYCHF